MLDAPGRILLARNAFMKGQRHRECGCFCHAWDLHVRCARHWEAGDCVFYQTDFVLEISGAVCVTVGHLRSGQPLRILELFVLVKQDV
jgi:hypothetical protein